MAKLFGFDKLSEDIATLLEADIRQRIESAKSEYDIQKQIGRVESPIEWLFFYSITEYCRHFSENHYVNGLGWYKEFLEIDWSYDLAGVGQAKEGDYRIDFAFAVVDETGVRHTLAVECDGHDYHERTKDQAARDRSRDRHLQAIGYTVMRFTGRELYLDPVKCVLEVMEWATKKRLIGASRRWDK